MPVKAPARFAEALEILRDPAVQTGVYTGAALSIVFATWVLLANRAPWLEPYANERNLCAMVLFCGIASVPVVRFFRAPTDQLLANFIAWSLMTLTYRTLCKMFSLLDEHYSTTQVFVLGLVPYLILATLSWIGNMVWRVRSAHLSHPNH